MQEDINQKARKAISAALEGRWEEALRLNQEILKEDPLNTEALGRLARAYSEIGDIKTAKKTARKILSLDPHNTIARKSLKKWSKLKSKKTSLPTTFIRPNLFIEEPGKTKIVTLTHPGNPKTLAKLDAGDEIKFNIRGHKINLTTLENEYIGRLPDDINCRLKKLIKLGNEYQIFIKSIEDNEVKVFIKETKKTKKTKEIPSFATEKLDYVSFTPPELVHSKEDFLPLDDEEKMEE